MLKALLTPANALVVELMLATGLRISDCLCLRSSQLNNQRFTVSESKTHKRKRIYLPRSLWERLKAQAGEVYVFEGAKSVYHHRTRQAVWWDIKRAAKAMRLEKGISPHSARKSYAVAQYRRSGDLEYVRERLNHDQIETTILYLLSEFKKDLH